MGSIFLSNSTLTLTIIIGFFIPAQAQAASQPGNLKVILVGDLNGRYGDTTYQRSVEKSFKAIKAHAPDIVLGMGDYVAGQKPVSSNLPYAEMWRAFDTIVLEKLRLNCLPFAPSPGNHDASGYRAYAHERAFFKDFWNGKDELLKNETSCRRNRVKFKLEPTGNYPFYYAVTSPEAIFIALDATMPGQLGREQMTWLKGMLDHHKAKLYKVVYGHVPLLPVAQKREKEFLALGNRDFGLKFESMMRKYGVSLIAGGHGHAYYPGLRKGKARQGPDSKTLNYVATPCAGSGPRKLIGESSRSPVGFVVIELEAGRLKKIQAYTTSGTALSNSSLPSELRAPSISKVPTELFLDNNRLLFKRMP